MNSVVSGLAGPAGHVKHERGGTLRISFIIVTLLASGCTSGELITPTDPRARDTGTFPTFSANPGGATQQFPTTGVDGEIAALAADGAAASSSARPPSDNSAELRRVGDTHAAETIRRIERR